MKKKRIVPLVLFRSGYVVQSHNFGKHRKLGLLDGTLKRLEEWGADEIVVLNISDTELASSEDGRSDLASDFQFDFVSALEANAKLCSIPLTIGGGIRDFEYAAQLFNAGADKLLVNSLYHLDKSVVSNLIDSFGSQAVVLGVDFKVSNNGYEVWFNRGKELSTMSLSQLVKDAESLGVGEIFLNSIDRDGMKTGLDLDVLNYFSNPMVPVIICGGVGNEEQLCEGLAVKGVDGVAAANYFQHIENSLPLARKSALEKGMLVRRVFPE